MKNNPAVTRRRIPTSRLRVGMQVCDQQSRQGDRRYLLRSFVIRSSAEIAVLQRHFDYLYVDENARDRAPAERERLELTELSSAAPFANELASAKRLLNDAHSVVDELLTDLRFGRSINLPRVRNSVSALLRGVLRNRNAMLFLAQLNNTDRDLAQRAVNVAIVALVFGRAVAVPKRDLQALGLAGLLVDLGMMLVPPGVRNKPGPLTPDEFNQVKEHVETGQRLLSRLPDLPPLVEDVIRTHHERFDGGGYPRALRGREIAFPGRMMAIASVYIALTSRRAYADALPLKDALSRLYAECDRAFDGRLVEKFIRCIGVYPPGSVVRLSDGRTAWVMAADESTSLRPLLRSVATGELIDLLRTEHHGIHIERALRPEEFQAWLDDDGTPRVVLISEKS